MSTLQALSRQPRVRRAAIMIAIAVVLEAVIFGRYFVGLAVPPSDFFGGYNTDAYTWWHDGGIFSVPAWSAQRLAGFPSALSLQNSSWYLPVGLMAAITPFTLHASTVLAALHVAFGFAGTYVLLRRLNLDFLPSALGATAAFFAVGYFTNAEHVDIARSYAWMPWLLLVLSTRFPWGRIWSVPVAALILWQAVVAMYPGVTVAAVYVGAVWVVYWQLRDRPKVMAYLVQLLAAGVIAVLLLGPKLIPYVLVNAPLAPEPETSTFIPEMLGTLVFGYEGRFLPGSPSMRSFFVPATVIALAFFARLRLPSTGAGLVVIVPSLLLGIPLLPWFQASQSLPGLSLSRFTMSDFKVFLITGLVILAASGMHSLLKEPPRPAGAPVRWTLLVSLAGVLVGVGFVGRFLAVEWVPGMVILIVAIVGVSLLLRAERSKLLVRWTSVALIGLTAVSGAQWAISNPYMWSQNRTDYEVATYGSTVEDLLQARADAPQAPLTQRPARTPLADRTDALDILNLRWNRGAYSGEYTIGGYIQPKGFPAQDRIIDVLMSTSGDRFMALLAAPGALVPMTTALPLASTIEECAESGDCGELQEDPTSYSPGHFVFATTADLDTEVSLNEAYYDGWQAQACAVDGGDCVPLEVTRDGWGLVHLTVPAGSSVVRVDYVAPGAALGWITLYAGLGLAALTALSVALVRRRA